MTNQPKFHWRNRKSAVTDTAIALNEELANAILKGREEKVRPFADVNACIYRGILDNSAWSDWHSDRVWSKFHQDVLAEAYEITRAVLSLDGERSRKFREVRLFWLSHMITSGNPGSASVDWVGSGMDRDVATWIPDVIWELREVIEDYDTDGTPNFIDDRYHGPFTYEDVLVKLRTMEQLGVNLSAWYVAQWDVDAYNAPDGEYPDYTPALEWLDDLTPDPDPEGSDLKYGSCHNCGAETTYHVTHKTGIYFFCGCHNEPTPEDEDGEDDGFPGGWDDTEDFGDLDFGDLNPDPIVEGLKEVGNILDAMIPSPSLTADLLRNYDPEDPSAAGQKGIALLFEPCRHCGRPTTYLDQGEGPDCGQCRPAPDPGPEGVLVGVFRKADGEWFRFPHLVNMVGAEPTQVDLSIYVGDFLRKNGFQAEDFDFAWSPDLVDMGWDLNGTTVDHYFPKGGVNFGQWDRYEVIELEHGDHDTEDLCGPWASDFTDPADAFEYAARATRNHPTFQVDVVGIRRRPHGGDPGLSGLGSGIRDLLQRTRPNWVGRGRVEFFRQLDPDPTTPIRDLKVDDTGTIFLDGRQIGHVGHRRTLRAEGTWFGLDHVTVRLTASHVDGWAVEGYAFDLESFTVPHNPNDGTDWNETKGAARDWINAFPERLLNEVPGSHGGLFFQKVGGTDATWYWIPTETAEQLWKEAVAMGDPDQVVDQTWTKIRCGEKVTMGGDAFAWIHEPEEHGDVVTKDPRDFNQVDRPEPPDPTQDPAFVRCWSYHKTAGVVCGGCHMFAFCPAVTKSPKAWANVKRIELNQDPQNAPQGVRV